MTNSETETVTSFAEFASAEPSIVITSPMTRLADVVVNSMPLIYNLRLLLGLSIVTLQFCCMIAPPSTAVSIPQPPCRVVTLL